MANSALVGAPLLASGAILSAAPGTAVPTDAVTALAAGFKGLGLVGEDGITKTTDRATEPVRAWGGSIARVVQTEFGLTYTFVFLETNPRVMREVHGAANVTLSGTGATSAMAIAINDSPLPRRVYVFEVKDGDNRIRIVCPNAQITNVGDVSYVHSDVIRYEVTVTCYKDGNGNEGYEYISGPAAVDPDAAA